jgi:hypothetical protein
MHMSQGAIGIGVTFLDRQREGRELTGKDKREREYQPLHVLRDKRQRQRAVQNAAVAAALRECAEVLINARMYTPSGQVERHMKLGIWLDRWLDTEYPKLIERGER